MGKLSSRGMLSGWKQWGYVDSHCGVRDTGLGQQLFSGSVDISLAILSRTHLHMRDSQALNAEGRNDSQLTETTFSGQQL